MNKNPLLVKSSITGKIPFMKGKTGAIYKKFISDNKFHKLLAPEVGGSEVLSAYSLNSEYITDFIFDEVEVSNSTTFSEKEWVALGMLLRAYKEVDTIDLLHLYNCLFKEEGKVVYGHVVTGRTYTLYTSTQLPVIIRLKSGDLVLSETKLKSLNTLSPLIFRVPINTGSFPRIETLVEIEIEFSGSSPQTCTLLEGCFDGLLDGRDEGSISKLISGPQDKLVPEQLKVCEYSDRLVEFFAGTLVTKLSNPKVISTASQVTNSSHILKFHNNDGFIGKEVRL